jgi:hypothetical protein
MRVSAAAAYCRPWPSIQRGAWKPSTALGVTQIRLRGILLSTSVQAEKQGPSTITRWPDCRNTENSLIYDPTSPQGLASIRTSARAGVATTRSQRATKDATWPNAR